MKVDPRWIRTQGFKVCVVWYMVLGHFGYMYLSPFYYQFRQMDSADLSRLQGIPGVWIMMLWRLVHERQQLGWFAGKHLPGQGRGRGRGYSAEEPLRSKGGGRGIGLGREYFSIEQSPQQSNTVLDSPHNKVEYPGTWRDVTLWLMRWLELSLEERPGATLFCDSKNQMELFSGAILVQRTMTQSGLWQMFIQSMFIERYTLKM